MLSPREIIESLSVDEFILMCRLSPCKFDVLKITRHPDTLWITVIPRYTTELAITLVIRIGNEKLA